MENADSRATRVLCAAGIVFVGAVVYALFVYAVWYDLDQLQRLALPFAALSICLGFAVAGFPFHRPLRTAFVCGIATPPLGFLLHAVLSAMVPPAAAGGPGMMTGGDLVRLIAVWGGFVLVIAMLFGTLSSAGCFLGLRFGRAARRLLASPSQATSGGQATARGVDPAAALTAKVTVAVALIGAAANLAIAMI